MISFFANQVMQATASVSSLSSAGVPSPALPSVHALQGLPNTNAAVMNPVVANGGGGPGGMGHIQTIVGGPPGAPSVAGLNPDENYCLRWNEYEKKYAETFRYLTFRCFMHQPYVALED